MEAEFKYYAFISYKREDEKWAKWLQNKLETYRIPTSLPKGDGKEYPKTFHPCFRDKTDLSETGNLEQILHDKLQQSKYLIVVCSPRSAQSKWVNKEVEAFQKMGRADQIIPFIIEGTPDASNPDTHCYPTSLDENILGISISEIGKEKAVVKTIAAMLNISFDTLWNRHRERVLKRRIQITVVSAIFIAAFGGFSAWQALKISKQKDEISIAYAKAEKLINAFYFYENKFALAYGSKGKYESNVFYFIDKDGDAVEKLGWWHKAEQFNENTGFAKVIDDEETVYLLDTLGNTYKYSNKIDELDDTIEALDLSRQNLYNLPERIEKFTNLKYLNLNGNDIIKLPAEMGNLTNLTDLYLHNNQLSVIPPEIGNLTKLTKLLLYENQLSVIPPEIGNLTKLTKLLLYENQLSVIPPEIGNLTNLTGLGLIFNQLQDIPPEIGNLTNLTDLYLSYNQLQDIPPEIGNLTNLTKLDLGVNQLKDIPPEIGNLTNLTNLYLNSNQLKDIPPKIGNLTNLEYLFLGGNQLKDIPPEIGNLTNLTKLNLDGNQLKDIPPEIGNLTNLTGLRLDDNRLQDIPPEIGKLTNLTGLWLDGNQLQDIPPEIGKLTNLEYLSLHNNQLSVIPPEIDNLTKLIYFGWYGNPLDSASMKRAEALIERNKRNNAIFQKF
ncbi:MAG: leucine-rich repeat domain-containing protein [Bacteroidales bacterium]|nr:leucine-rich repeat domain-containing protein [Bacteroidales bacterium]